MRKILSVLMVLAFLAGGTAWARGSSSNTGRPSSKSHSHKKKSKNTKGGKKKKSKASKTSRGKKGSKTEKVEAKTDIGQKDVEIDLKGQ